MIRIGHGYDVHSLIPGDGLIIGGVTIPSSWSFLAHSDGDVLIHALCDALLGAVGLGDIGQHFPDTDSQYKGIDSRILLRQVYSQVQQRGYALSNADITLIAQQPKMAPFLNDMKAILADDLKSKQETINIKATTTEKLGAIGRSEGIACHAVCLLTTEADVA